MGIYDVPATRLIRHIASDLESNLKVQQPAFTAFVKTGAHRERAPTEENWYYMRLGSLLYRLFKEGSLGVNSLRSYYGGKRNRGVKPEHHVKASGKIIRVALQQLEKDLGFVKKEDKKGRVITGKGHSYLNKKAKELEVVLAEEQKQLAAKARFELEQREKLKAELALKQEQARLKQEQAKQQKQNLVPGQKKERPQKEHAEKDQGKEAQQKEQLKVQPQKEQNKEHVPKEHKVKEKKE